MNKTEIVELALKILTELDRDEGRAVPVETLNRGEETGNVSALVNRLSAAGIVAWEPGRAVSLRCSLADLTAMDVLQAVWGTPAERTEVRVLYGASVDYAIAFDMNDAEGRN